jgi:hypothetical protein
MKQQSKGTVKFLKIASKFFFVLKGIAQALGHVHDYIEKK